MKTWHEAEPGDIARAPAPKFHLTAFHDLRPGNDPTYLVKGLVPRVGLTVVWGPPKCGKSFWTYDLAMCVALECRYRDRPVQGGSVVYCAFEGAEGFKARAEAYRRHHAIDGAEGIAFYLVAAQMDLAKDASALVASVRAQLSPDDLPALVVLDTLNRSLRGSESDDKDMAAYIKAADSIREAFDCAVIIVHHCGIDATRPRGHTSLAGAADAQIAIKRDAAENIIATVEFQKDGPDGDVIVSALETVEIGTDSDGDAIRSCVIVPSDAPAPQSSTRRMTDLQHRAVAALTEAVNASGNPVPATWGLPAGIHAVSLEAWREEMFRNGALDRDEKNPRASFNRLRLALTSRNIMGERDGLVWRV